MRIQKERPVDPSEKRVETVDLLSTGKPRKKKTTSETTIQREIVDYLRKRGLLVKITASHRQQAFGMKGVPDLIVHGPDWTLYIECKSKTGELRPAQVQFQKDISRYTGKHLMYTVARSLDDVVKFFILNNLNNL
jgi:hypothetical protein